MDNNFIIIYDQYHDAIFRYCLWKSHDRAVAQDLMQETFLRFWICLQRKQKVLHTRAFLYRIAHNLFINSVRKKKEESLDHLLESGFEPVADPWKQTFSHLDAERPLAKLRTMKKVYKDVLCSRFLRGQSPAEIAVSTGETPNTISIRIFRGLKILRTLLKEAPQALREFPLISV
jgi:RNA polymerase sigma-70 factor (ECF subfamily)